MSSGPSLGAANPDNAAYQAFRMLPDFPASVWSKTVRTPPKARPAVTDPSSLVPQISCQPLLNPLPARIPLARLSLPLQIWAEEPTEPLGQ